ncbi:LuxR C-terminal-related transcriptional regulator [Sulfurimonas sp.]|uniref:LuxR C-terminal-related transcriptional regulator n=1 Tax=Sulfurimonas sp. TaxID=2022749 RepID=UPI00260FB175|nr:LuxR C-terminal-related transcriptional regulator [Sulfurimonas sp.]
MKNIIIFTNSFAIEKHWKNALNEYAATTTIEEFKNLVEYLQLSDEKTIVMFDEQSVVDIEKALEELNVFTHIDLLLFHNFPDVEHAVKLIGKNVRGYENSFIHKANLLQMLESVENEKNWFFLDLTQHIINSFIKQNRDEDKKQEPAFVKELTNKEQVILDDLAQGFSNKEIAYKEQLALSTVKGHIRNIFKKAGVSDRVSLILLLG